MRTLLIVLAVALAVLAARFLLRRRRAARPRQMIGDMVRCARCGLHVPSSEALPAAGKWYCCDAHRAAASGEPRG